MHAFKVLEFSAIRDRLQAQCETVIGAALAGELRPSFAADEVWEALALTSEAHDAIGRQTPPSLWGIKDLRQPLKRASKGGVLGATELFSVGDALSAMRALKSFLTPLRDSAPLLYPYSESLPDLKRLEDNLLESIDGDGTIKDSASPALATLRQKKRAAASRIAERIQSYISGKTRELLSDPIYTVRDGRYVIPLKAENRGKIRGIVHDTSSSGQTIYVEPEDVLQLGNALREVESNERQEELRILTALSAKVGASADEITGGIEAAGAIDLAFGKARLGFEMKGTMPLRAASGSFIDVQGGKHPLLDPEIVVPLNMAVGKGNNVLITGPNTGGKTVAIKCIGLFVLMAQSGLMLPALNVKFGPFTQIWADIGDEQSLQQSLSTFSGHIKNIAEALRLLKEGAIVLMDEIGAGTDPAEGAALARSILTDMASRGATVLASTHYGELKAFAYNTDGFQNAAMEFDTKTLRPTYRVLMGTPGASHALRIAERYGIPKTVVEQARGQLTEQEQDIALMLERLEQAQRQARIAQGEADRRTEELKKAETRATRKLEEADQIRSSVHSKASEVIEAALREIRLDAQRLFDELKKAPADPKIQDKVRKGLRELQDVGADFAQEFVPKKPREEVTPVGLKKGSTVKIDGYTQPGTLVDDPKDGKVTVQVGMLRMTVPAHRLTIDERSATKLMKPRTNIRLQKAINATTEIHLRHMRAEEAVRDLEKFVDDAMLAGLPSIRIVHGKGEGVLRKVTQDFLRRHSGVESYRDGEPAEGGHGVTIVTFH